MNTRTVCPSLPECKPVPNESFDWAGPEVLIEEQFAVAVYLNNGGDAVIHQQAPYGFGVDDAVIVIAADRVPRLIAALTYLVEPVAELERPADATPEQPRKDRTAAERQRRRRARLRSHGNGHGINGVTVTPAVSHGG